MARSTCRQQRRRLPAEHQAVRTDRPADWTRSIDQPETRCRHARRDPAAASRRERREHRQRLDHRSVSRHPRAAPCTGVRRRSPASRKPRARARPAGIRVNAIAAETTETEQVKPSLFIQPQYREHIPRWIPLGRFGLPSDVRLRRVSRDGPPAWVTARRCTSTVARWRRAASTARRRVMTNVPVVSTTELRSATVGRPDRSRRHSPVRGASRPAQRGRSAASSSLATFAKSQYALSERSLPPSSTR